MSVLRGRIAVVLLAIWAAAASVQLCGGSASAAVYDFADGHTTVHFSWGHAGLSRHTGRIVGAKGTLEFDPTNPTAAKLDVQLAAENISTGVAALDRLLRGSDFFDVLRHPAIAFRATGIQITGERTGDVTGDLTIGTITRPVTLAVKWNFSGEHPLGLVNPSFAGKFVSGFSATTRILRSEWGLGRGAPLISDDVDIAIEAEVVRK
ncbi:MAG: YceI family protein [Hyphomicrobiaceae bacterium]